MKCASRQAGFSLIEVLCATLILGVAIVGLAGGLSTALGAGRDSERQTAALMFAAGLIETLRAEGYYTDGETEGDCGPGLEQYRWRQAVVAADVDGLHEVTVSIEQRTTGKLVASLQTLVFEAPREVTEATRESTREREGGSRRGSGASQGGRTP